MMAFIYLIELPKLYYVFIERNLAELTINQGMAGCGKRLKYSPLNNIYKGFFTLLIPVGSTSPKDIDRAPFGLSFEEGH